MTHTEFTPHAYITLSNSGSIEIMFNRSNDGAYYRFNYGQDNLENEEIFEAEILYSVSEHEEDDCLPYFEHNYNDNGSVSYFLNEAMRINPFIAY